MSIRIFIAEKARALGLEITSHASYPPECFEDSYEGAVLELYERNGHSDSDFYAVVWDDSTGSIMDIEYATTRGWTYLSSANIDATPEVIAKALEHVRGRMIACAPSAARRQASIVREGVRVTVKRGRKVPKGFTGRVAGVRDEFAFVIADDGSSWNVARKHCDVTYGPDILQQLIERNVAQAIAYNPPNWQSAAYAVARA